MCIIHRNSILQDNIILDLIISIYHTSIYYYAIIA